MQSKYFDVTRIKKQYKKLSPNQRWVVIGGGVVLLAVMITGVGRLYIQHTTELESRVNEEAEKLFRQADQHFSNEQYRQAATGFENYAYEVEGYSRFHGFTRAAEAWEQHESYHRSIDVYKKALEVESTTPSEYPYEHAEVHAGLSRSLEQTGAFGEAITHTQKRREALEQVASDGENEDNQSVQRSIATASTRIRLLRERETAAQYQQAKTHVDQADELLSSEDTSRQDMEKAIEQYQKAISVFEAHSNIPQTAERKQRYQNKVQVLQRALQEHSG